MSQHVDYLLTPSFFIKMLFLVVDFVIKTHIISISHITSFHFFVFKARLLIQIVNFKRYVFGTAFCEKAVF